MKKLILLTLITFLFSCKKEDIKPEESNTLAGIYRVDHYHTTETYSWLPGMNGPPEHTTTYDYAVYDSYIRFSDVEDNSAKLTTYKYNLSNLTQEELKCTISDDTIILSDQKYHYEIIGSVLKLEGSSLTISNCGPDSGSVHSRKMILTYSRISSLPTSGSGGGGSGGGTGGGGTGGGGTGCQYGQCQATAQSTGQRCKKCVSSPGDIYCHLHD